MKKTVTISVITLLFLTHSAFADEASLPTQKTDAPAAAAKAQVEVKAAKSTGGSNSEVSEPVSMGVPIERAKGEKLATAMGHYARARSLLIAAIREFDKGYAMVDPNALLDSRMWRDSLLDRSEELARLLDPQPRATKGGVKFGAETRGIGDAGR